jgi:hypothetical protein
MLSLLHGHLRAQAEATGEYVTLPGVRLKPASALVPLLYLAISCFYYSRYLLHLGKKIPGGPDGVLYAWFFESVRRAVVTGHNPLYTDYVNAPAGLNLMWNTAILGLALVCLPLTWLIGAPGTIVLLMALSPALSATCAYVALRRLAGNPGDGALGGGAPGGNALGGDASAGVSAPRGVSAAAGLLYGFGPYFVGQGGHLHLILAFLPPLLLLLGFELIVRQPAGRWSYYGIRLGAAVAAAILCGEEVVAMASVGAVVAIVVLALLYPHQVAAKVPYAAKGIGLGAGIAVVVTAYPLWFQFFGPRSLWQGPKTEIGLNLASIVRPSSLQLIAPHADVVANRVYTTYGLENTGYLGWPLTLTLVALIARALVTRNRIVLWWGGTAGVLLALSCGPRIRLAALDLGPGPWQLLSRLPVMSSIVPVRLSLLTSLFIAFGLTHAMTRMLTGRRGRITILTVVLALFVPLVPYGRYDTRYEIPTPRFFTDSAALATIRPGATVLLLPHSRDPGVSGQHMMWQLRSHLRFKIVGGYGVFEVGGKSSYRSEDPYLATVLAEVADTGVRPGPGPLAAAAASIAPAGLDYLVLTGPGEHAALVQELASQLTGCRWQPVLDVSICALPRP